MASNAGELLREVQARADMASMKIEVPSFGNFNSDTAIVGEYPGEYEFMQKMPMVGNTGKLLFNVLQKQGITRQHVWTTNVIRHRVTKADGHGESEKLSISTDEKAHWAGILDYELSQLPNLKYVLVLGNAALHALTGEVGITHWRGSVLPWKIRSVAPGSDGPLLREKEVTLVIANNPALIFKDPKQELIFHFDMDKLRRVRTGAYQPHVIEPITNPTPVDAIRWVERMHDEKLPVALDIETMSHETACIGLTNSTNTGMCINFRDRFNNRWSVEDERTVRKSIARLVTAPTTRLVTQNGTFDSYWLWYKDRIRLRQVWFDTLLAHHTLYPSLPHDLGFLTSQYTTHPYYKDDGKNWREDGDIETFWKYNVKDICITLACQKRLLGELQAQKLDQFFFNHVMRLQPKSVRMTVGGVLCDRPLKAQITEDVGKDVAAKEETFKNLVRIAAKDDTLDVNPRSPKQLSDLFFRRLQLVGRGTSTDANNRKRMLSHPRTSSSAKDVILALDRYAEENKFLTTYAEMVVDDDDRIRCEYKQYGTQKAPGRLSSAAVMWGSGMNLQNQPDRAKAMFVADPGYRFLYFDLSQAEARIVAYHWKVQALIQNFEAAAVDKSLDVHRANASRIFKVPYDEIPSFDRWELGKNTDDPSLAGKPTKRFLGKRCVHGLNYRMGPDRLAETCDIPYGMALEAYIAYHRAFPEIKVAWDAIVKEVYRTHELWNLLGRRLKFLGRLPQPGANEGTEEANVLESIVAFVPQSTIGDKVCSNIYQIEDDPAWPSTARMALNVHDALIALVPDDDDVALHCARIMKKHAESPILIHGHPVSIPADFAWSYATMWSDEKGTFVPANDTSGYHRWSNLKKFKLELTA